MRGSKEVLPVKRRKATGNAIPLPSCMEQWVAACLRIILGIDGISEKQDKESRRAYWDCIKRGSFYRHQHPDSHGDCLDVL